ncbi:hypothetical protein ACHQM5_003080 [Ranunculus cassubicifolius]
MAHAITCTLDTCVLESRLCVKNIPEYVSISRLKDHFSQKGQVTDVKLLRTKCGRSKRVAFVGFRTEGEAQAALKYFHNSYIDSSKINCEVAHPIGDSNIPTTWSRHSKKKQEEVKNSSDAKRLVLFRQKGELKTYKKKSIDRSDPTLEEFLHVMQPRSQSKVWANDTVGHLLNQSGENKANKWVLNRCTSSLPLMRKQENDSTKRSHKLDQDELLSGLDFLKSRVNKEWSESDEDAFEASMEKNSDERTPQAQAESGNLFDNLDSRMNEMPNDKNKLVGESGRLYVHNLPFTVTEDDFTELFQRFGNLSEVHLVRDKDTKMFKGYAFVRYALPDSAIRALEELDNLSFQGRILHVVPANQPKSPEKPLTNVASRSSKTYKEQKAECRKSAEASGDTRAWNSLFMRPDTVVENIAGKHGVSKSDILDPEGNDLAVLSALGETQVIADTKKALVNSGVNVTALEKLMLLNLPYSTSEGDLAEFFGKYGRIDKIILAPTKTLAVVVFLEAGESNAAFKGLSYRFFKGSPLYLERAPRDILSFTTNTANDSKDVDAKRDTVELPERSYEDPDSDESSSLFVKNLNFKTSDECLRAHFSVNLKEGSIRSAKVQRYMRNGKLISQGFGFVEFDSVQTARNMCESLQGSILDGHALKLEISLTKKVEERAKSGGTKLVLKNLAFEATRKDIRKLFSPFGQIKRLGVPRKPAGSGGHRGFAFVEFFTKQEAQDALRALSNTHLYGRHMVMEIAKEDGDLGDLRIRTGDSYIDERNGFQTKSKKRKLLHV